ncbi:hypothetical protein DL98DRAFT_584198 [Cadophora sp. DSE1049]|nr:hypothetical protein DL98DRAFT_584198 [Cadophora sp. DSE1049]
MQFPNTISLASIVALLGVITAATPIAEIKHGLRYVYLTEADLTYVPDSSATLNTSTSELVPAEINAPHTSIFSPTVQGATTSTFFPTLPPLQLAIPLLSYELTTQSIEIDEEINANPKPTASLFSAGGCSDSLGHQSAGVNGFSSCTNTNIGGWRSAFLYYNC